jgi:hypothetical protein
MPKSSGNSTSRNSSSHESFQALVPPTGTGKCGVVPTPIPSSVSQYFSQIHCDNNFDKNVDDFFTYLRDTGNLNGALRAWAPNTGITSANIPDAGTSRVRTRRGVIDKRDLGDFLSGVVHVYEAVISIVIDVVLALASLARNLAAALLPTYDPSGSFTVPVALEAPSVYLDSNPWGQNGLVLWKWTPKEGEQGFDPSDQDELAKMLVSNQIIPYAINGAQQLPEPGVSVWCIDCGVHGSIEVKGSAIFTPVGPTKLQLNLHAILNANIQFGIDGFAKYKKNVLDVPLMPPIALPGLGIEGVIAIGPYLTVDLVASVTITALGQILTGLNFDWPEMGFFIDVLRPDSASSYGFVPIVTPVFNVTGNVSAVAQLGIPVGINLGVDLLDGAWEEAIAIVNTPAFQAVAEYTASWDAELGNTAANNTCVGIHYYSDLINTLQLQVPSLGAVSVWLLSHKFIY